MWKASISFGLVTIPVKLYAATESKDVRFHLLHSVCHTPVQYRKWCPQCDQEVAPEAIVRGYEYDRGRYVEVPEADLESIPIAAAHTVDIVDFVRLEQIDPIYFEKTYFLEPGEGGAKAYALLRRAMESTGRIAVARVVIRSKESLAAIRIYDQGVLAMETMRFPDEVRSPAGLLGPEPSLRPQEVDMASSLIGSLAGEFTPEKFKNEYRQAVLDLVQAKATGQEVVQAEERPARGRVADLMQALQASIRHAEAERAAALPPTMTAPLQPVPGFSAPVPGPAGPVVPIPAAAPGVPVFPNPAAAPGLSSAPPPIPGRPPAPGPALAPGTTTPGPGGP